MVFGRSAPQTIVAAHPTINAAVQRSILILRAMAPAAPRKGKLSSGHPDVAYAAARGASTFSPRPRVPASPRPSSPSPLPHQVLHHEPLQSLVVPRIDIP